MNPKLLEIREEIRDRMPSRDRLQRYLLKFSGRTIPGVAICEDHDSPLSFVKELIHGEDDLIVLANRTGGKTANTGIATALIGYHLGASSKILGGSAAQSYRLYEESQWFVRNGFEKRVVGDILKSGMLFTTGAAISMMTQSMRSTRGPHPPLCVYDEVDEFEDDVYMAGKSIPRTDPDVDFPSKMVELSTRHYAGGIMAREWNQHREGRKRFVWCVWEVMKACIGRWGKDDFTCSTCPLRDAGCPGKDRMSKGEGYLTKRDVLQAWRRLDDDAWNSEWLCKQPRKSGMVYQDFSQDVHCRERLVRDPQAFLWRSCDYGTDNETVIGYFQVDGIGRVRCLQELRWSGTAPSTIVAEMIQWEKQKDWHYFGGTIVDPSALGFRKELEKAGKGYPKNKGLRTTIGANNSVDLGIFEVRNGLVVQTDGKPRLLFDPVRCKIGIKEMEGYMLRNGIPVKKNDHFPDLLRYYIMSCPGYSRTTASGGLRGLGVLS